LGGRRLTFVGSNNNETAGAGVAILEGEVTGSAPSVPGRASAQASDIG